jgi:sugar (pentulose or hexulose) kinase
MLQDALEDEGVCPDKLKIAGSGSRSDLWPRIIADVLDVPVQASATAEVSLTGEALLGQTALGTYGSLEEACRHMVKGGASFEPRSDNVETYRDVRRGFAEVLRTSRQLYSDASD